MKINKKIKEFIKDKGLTMTEIADRYGKSQQSVSNYLSPGGYLPLEFVVWLAEEFPDFNLDLMLRDKPRAMVVSENSLLEKKLKKDQILAKIGVILDEEL